MRYILALYIIHVSASVNSQSLGREEIWVEGKFKAGFLAAHRGMIGHLPTEHAFAGELSYLIQGKGQKDWHNYLEMWKVSSVYHIMILTYYMIGTLKIGSDGRGKVSQKRLQQKKVENKIWEKSC